MACITVSIRNWHKFNPRSDRANHTWFRLENNFFTNMFSVTGNSQRLFLFVCCEASKKCKAEVAFDSRLAAALLQVEHFEIMRSLEELCQEGLLSETDCLPSESRPDAADQPALLPTTNEQTDRQTNVTNSGQFVPSAFFQKLLQDHSGPPLKCKVPLILSPKDCIRAKQRWDEMPDEGYWYSVMDELAKNDMFTGKVKKSDGTRFQITLGYLLKPEVHLKAMNGDFNFGGSDAKKVWEVVE